MRMRNHYHMGRRNNKGFTLIELMVVVVIIALLAGLAVPAINGALIKAKQVKCASNMRQIGMAMLMYAGENNNRLPLNTSHGGTEHFRVLLEPYISEDAENVFQCPHDPQGEERLAAGSSSYVLNFWTSSVISNPLRGINIDYTNTLRLNEKSSVPLLFIISDNKSVGPSNDHTHGNLWNSWSAVYNDVEVDRFRNGSRSADRVKGSTNVLYADGRVEAFLAREFKSRFEEDPHFARPQS